jgi:hypothetical protein
VTNDWTPESLYDYFDQYAGVASRRAAELATLPLSSRVERLNEVRRAWSDRLRRLDEEGFVTILVTVVEDLYFLGVALEDLSRELLAYVVAVWGTALHEASRRGYRVRYLVDNYWTNPDRASAVFSLLCPAAEMTLVVALDDEGANALHSLEGHVLYLDPRGLPDCLERALSEERQPGDVVIERHAAPEPGSPAHAWVTPVSLI